MNFTVCVFSRDNREILCEKMTERPYHLQFTSQNTETCENVKDTAIRLIFEHTGRMAHIIFELPIMPKTMDWRKFDTKDFTDFVLIAELIVNKPLEVLEFGQDYVLRPVGKVFGNSDLKVIAVDGVAKAGKGTYCKSVADLLGIGYLESGLLYRGMTAHFGIDPNKPSVKDLMSMDSETYNALSDEKKAWAQFLSVKEHNHKSKAELQAELENEVCKLLPDAKDILFDTEKSELFVGNKKYTRKEMKSEKINNLVANYSEIVQIREVVKEVQKNTAKGKNGLLVEGRDIGTEIFPCAPIKFYVTASVQIRAMRTLRENQASTYVKALESISNRDNQDSDRPISPLRASFGAVVIDSTHLTEDEAIKAMFLVCCSQVTLKNQ